MVVDIFSTDLVTVMMYTQSQDFVHLISSSVGHLIGVETSQRNGIYIFFLRIHAYVVVVTKRK